MIIIFFLLDKNRDIYSILIGIYKLDKVEVTSIKRGVEIGVFVCNGLIFIKPDAERIVSAIHNFDTTLNWRIRPTVNDIFVPAHMNKAVDALYEIGVL